MKAKKKGNPVLALRIPQDLFDRLEAYCKANNVTTSEVVRRLLLGTLLTPEEQEAETKARLTDIEAKQHELEERARDVRNYFSHLPAMNPLLTHGSAEVPSGPLAPSARTSRKK